MNARRLLGLAGLILAFGLAVAACGGSGEGSDGGGEGSFVTPGADAPVYVAMLTDGSTSLVHVTDTEAIHATFRGPAPGSEEGFTLSNEDGAALEAAPAGDGYTGTFTAASGETYDFTVEPVSRDNGGLYRNRETIRGEDWIIGLIVLNDGEIVGSARNEVTGDVEKRTTLSLGIKWDDPTADP